MNKQYLENKLEEGFSTNQIASDSFTNHYNSFSTTKEY